MRASIAAQKSQGRLHALVFAAALAACILFLACAGVPAGKAWAQNPASLPVASESSSEDSGSYAVTYHGDGDGFSASSEDLFAHFGSLVPGEQRTGSVTVVNASDQACDFYLHAKQTASANRRDAQEALSLVQLDIQPVGTAEPLYTGNLRAAELASGIYLATIEAGSSIELEFSVGVPADLGNEFALASVCAPWVIAAQETPGAPQRAPSSPEAPDTPLLAKTGSLPLAMLVGILFAVVVAAAFAAFAAKAHGYIANDSIYRRSPQEQKAHRPQDGRSQ